MRENYKVETKDSLFEVTIEYGCYSDWRIFFFLFAGHNEEEVWDFIKIWAKEGGFSESNDIYGSFCDGTGYGEVGLMWNEHKFQFRELQDEVNWDNEYGNAFLVKIKRANIIYTTPKKFLEDNN